MAKKSAWLAMWLALAVQTVVTILFGAMVAFVDHPKKF
jgi:hypothetical protein